MARGIKLPAVGAEGELYGHVGRHAGMVVMTAFEMVGGVDRLADWADKNYGEFATKLLPKVIAKPHEHSISVDSPDSIIAKIEAEDAEHRRLQREAVDAEFEDVGK